MLLDDRNGRYPLYRLDDAAVIESSYGFTGGNTEVNMIWLGSATDQGVVVQFSTRSGLLVLRTCLGLAL